MMSEKQFNWDGQSWHQTEVGAEPSQFAFGILDEFAYIAVQGEQGDEEFFTLGSNPGLAFGDPEWIFAQDNPDYVVSCLAAPAAFDIVDKYLSRLDDEKPRGNPRQILNELVECLELPPLPW